MPTVAGGYVVTRGTPMGIAIGAENSFTSISGRPRHPRRNGRESSLPPWLTPLKIRTDLPSTHGADESAEKQRGRIYATIRALSRIHRGQRGTRPHLFASGNGECTLWEVMSHPLLAELEMSTD